MSISPLHRDLINRKARELGLPVKELNNPEIGEFRIKKTTAPLNRILESALQIVKEYSEMAERSELILLYNLYENTDIELSEHSEVSQDLVDRISQVAREFQVAKEHAYQLLLEWHTEADAHAILYEVESGYWRQQTKLLSPRVKQELQELVESIVSVRSRLADLENGSEAMEIETTREEMENEPFTEESLACEEKRLDAEFDREHRNAEKADCQAACRRLEREYEEMLQLYSMVSSSKEAFRLEAEHIQYQTKAMSKPKG